MSAERTPSRSCVVCQKPSCAIEYDVTENSLRASDSEERATKGYKTRIPDPRNRLAMYPYP